MGINLVKKNILKNGFCLKKSTFSSVLFGNIKENLPNLFVEKENKNVLFLSSEFYFDINKSLKWSQSELFEILAKIIF